jgi:hypothetical protein
VLCVGLGSPLAMALSLPEKLVTLLCQARCLDDALVFPRGYLLVERQHAARVPIECPEIEFAPHVASTMPKASIERRLDCPAISLEGCQLESRSKSLSLSIFEV